MKLTRETQTNYLIRGWEPGSIQIDDRQLVGDVIISPEQLVEDWQPPAPQAMTMAALAPALALDPAILLLGTGHSITFPDADLAGLLAVEGIGFEVMTTPAACRTYNVLAVEGRPVVAAILNLAND